MLFLIILIILPVIIVFLIEYGCAKSFYKIACMKGHNDRKYFWWTFFVPLMGALMVIALPAEKASADEQPSPVSANGNNKASHVRAAVASAFASNSVQAQKVVPAAAPRAYVEEKQIECPACGKQQNANRTVCWQCGIKLPGDASNDADSTNAAAAPSSSSENLAKPEVMPVVASRMRGEKDQIECPVCGLRQKADRSVCWECGAKFKK